MAEGMWLKRGVAAVAVAGIGLVMAGCAAKEPVVGVIHAQGEYEAPVEGAGYVHEGVNEGDTDVVLWVAYVIPEGEPLAQTELAKCDA